MYRVVYAGMPLYVPGWYTSGVYMPPYYLFVGGIPHEEASRDASRYPFHCWSYTRVSHVLHI